MTKTARWQSSEGGRTAARRAEDGGEPLQFTWNWVPGVPRPSRKLIGVGVRASGKVRGGSSFNGEGARCPWTPPDPPPSPDPPLALPLLVTAAPACLPGLTPRLLVEQVGRQSVHLLCRPAAWAGHLGARDGEEGVFSFSFPIQLTAACAWSPWRSALRTGGSSHHPSSQNCSATISSTCFVRAGLLCVVGRGGGEGKAHHGEGSSRSTRRTTTRRKRRRG